MIQRKTERGIEQYGTRLAPIVEDNVVTEKFQWLLVLDRIDGYDIRNRPSWIAVGPTFSTRKAASQWLGIGSEKSDPDAHTHADQLIAEYNSYYDDDPEGGRYGDASLVKFSQMGRPSQGRSQRLQATITDEDMNWLKSQRQDKETVSDIVWRLIQDARDKTR